MIQIKTQSSSLLQCAITIVLVALLSSCATTSFRDYPKVESTAIQITQDTFLGKRVAPYTEQHPDKSAFFLLENGIEALAARLVLAEKAESSIDLQYYILHADITGYLFVNSLLKAADRGVRVRILLDDITTEGYDAGMAALESHPNIEIRIFNPFSKRSVRLFSFITDFGRVNHRMHNKSFTVDNLFTIVGGRNIGAEYFAADEDVNFGDLDVIGVGPVVKEASLSFDEYWNSDAAIPVLALVEKVDGPGPLNERRNRMAEIEAEATETPYGEALEISYENLIGRGSEYIWATSRVIADSPGKIANNADSLNPKTLRSQLGPEVRATQENLFVVSPYFVPRDKGVELFTKLRESGVDVTIITNSLASNDVPAVHAGYSSYREELLNLGVEIWEVRADSDTSRTARQKRKLGYSQSSLHAKSFSIDDRYVFIGSFNWDPRSVEINTELGIYIDSPELTAQVKYVFMKNLTETAYKLRLDANGKLEWVANEYGKEVVYHKEPDTSLWMRTKMRLFKILPFEDQL